MSRFNTGPVSPIQVAGSIPMEVFGIAINWYAARSPMLFRLPKIADGSPTYQMVGHMYRPRTTTLGAAVADGVTTSITLADASSFMAGDVLKLATGEAVEIMVDPASPTVITVRRGIGGTTAAAQLISTPVFLIGNSRTGAEDQPMPVSSKLTNVTQYAQTIQHPYSVGGGVQSNTLFPVVPGANTPLEQYKMDAMQNATDDIEMTSCFGVGEANTTGVGRAKQFGLRTLITTNRAFTPVNASSYHAMDFQRDFLTAPRKAGGSPTVCYLASNWMDAFSTWGFPLQQLLQGDTVYGRTIKVYAAPFLGDVTIVESSLLPSFTGYSLTEAEARFRVKRPLMDEPYGKSGDNTKGHMITEISIELDNEMHHAWVEGITAFAA